MTSAAGTEWTEPGQGATALDLRDEVRHTLRRVGVFWPDLLVRRARRNVARILKGEYIRTNLRLTGEPLTTDDFERIAEAK